MSDSLLYFNGLRADTGDYETSPMTANALAQLVGKAKAAEQVPNFRLMAGIDPADLAQTGWGVIFAGHDEKETAALREALKPLLQHRHAQAAKANEKLYREFTGTLGYLPKETKNSWLRKHKIGPGTVDPKKMPYYLLIVGDPATIPFMFQYQLDVQYAVGRIHFDKLEDYARYAENVVRAETTPPFLAPRATFFGVANPDDRATALSAQHLIQPLAASAQQDQPGWAVESLLGDAAHKAQLGALLNGAQAPALLFTASHGMGFSNGSPLQLPHQGALLCQDWPGPKQWRKVVPADFYFAAEDLQANANLLGMVAFLFACYGCGTPQFDDYSMQSGDHSAIAPQAFLAQLPRKMLAQGALAVVGHVERAWGTSITWESAGAQTATFQSTLKGLMSQQPIGAALEDINTRYGELATLVTELEETHKTYPDKVDVEELVNYWTAHNDARGYALIGDPAVRLPLAADRATQRPTLSVTGSAPEVGTGGGLEAFWLGGNKEKTPTPATDETVETSETAKDETAPSLQSVQAALEKVGRALLAGIEKATTVEVHTYLADDPDAEPLPTKRPRHEAYSRITLDGDEEHKVPQLDGQVDEPLWKIHAGMLEQARRNRAEMLAAVLSVFKA